MVLHSNQKQYAANKAEKTANMTETASSDYLIKNTTRQSERLENLNDKRSGK